MGTWIMVAADHMVTYNWVADGGVTDKGVIDNGVADNVVATLSLLARVHLGQRCLW